MSETKQVEISLNDVFSAPPQTDSQEWIESTRGEVQLSDEEAKLRKKEGSQWFKLEDKEQILYIPLKTSTGELNTGKRSYKAYIAERTPPTIAHDAIEEFDNDQEFLNRKDKTQKPRLRHEVEVVLFTEGKKIPKKWDMSDTAYKHIFVEYLSPKNRVISVKKPTLQTSPPITKYKTREDLEELGYN